MNSNNARYKFFNWTSGDRSSYDHIQDSALKTALIKYFEDTTSDSTPNHAAGSQVQATSGSIRKLATQPISKIFTKLASIQWRNDKDKPSVFTNRGGGNVYVYTDYFDTPYSGSYHTDVFRGKLQGRDIAVKRLRYLWETGQDGYAETAQYLSLWHSMRHENILELLGIAEPHVPNTAPSLVLPWMEYDVRKYMENAKENHPDKNQKNLWLRQVSSAINYLHEQGVIHGNILGSNIMIDPDRRALLTDPGLFLVAERHAPDHYNTFRVTARWQAPELLQKSSLTKKSDVYSFAILSCEIYTEQDPFADIMPNSGNWAVGGAVVRGTRPTRPVHPTRMDDDLFKLVERCWHQLPNERPDMSEIVVHESLNGSEDHAVVGTAITTGEN